MPYLLSAVYLLGLVLLGPWLITRALRTGKYRRGLWAKLTGSVDLPRAPSVRTVAWFHGVSVGEIHLLRQVVAAFRQRHPDWECVVSTTTDTGHDEARRGFPDLTVFFWPLDFSWAVRRALRAVRPSLVVLAEGELWPNFLRAAKEFGIPVAVVNGRMSPHSLRRYRRLGFLTRPLFGWLDLCAAQTDEYAAAYRALGVAPDRLAVTGSVKFDGVSVDRQNPRTWELARLLDVRPGELVWIAGSTQAPEEQCALDIYWRLKPRFPRLRLLIVPRQKDRFEEVAGQLQRSGRAWVRRSTLAAPLTERDAVILVDTIGELGALWGLADVAFVGGSLDGRRGGQNMIEPAAYGAAVLFGPRVWNFRDTARRLVESGAAVQVADAADLERAVERLLSNEAERRRMGVAARDFVRRQQGATERTLDLLDRLIATSCRPPLAA
jgi:3-deoxy-D-manno-octulosonic-acid transferase